MSNFHFLEKGFPFIYKEATDTENHTFEEPRYAVLLFRSTLEKVVFLDL